MHRLRVFAPPDVPGAARVTSLLEVERYAERVALATYTLSGAERATFSGCLLCLQGGDGGGGGGDDDEGAWAPEPPDTDGLEERCAKLRATLETLPARRRAAELEVAELSATEASAKRARVEGAPPAPTAARRFALHRAQMALAALNEDVLRARLADCEQAIGRARREAGWLTPLRAAIRLGRVGAHALLYDVLRACTLCAPTLPRAPVVCDAAAQGAEPAPHLCHTVCAFRYLQQGRGASCTACRGVPGALRVGTAALHVSDGGARLVGTVVRCDWRPSSERTAIELSVTSANRFRLEPPLALTLSAAHVRQLSAERVAEADAHLQQTVAESRAEAAECTAHGGGPRQAGPPSLLAPPDTRHTIAVGTWVHGMCELLAGDSAETSYVIGLVTRERVMTPLGQVGVSLLVAQRDAAPGPSNARAYLAALVAQRNYVACAIETPPQLTCAVSTRQLRAITSLARRRDIEQRLLAGTPLNGAAAADAGGAAPPLAPFRGARGASVTAWALLVPLHGAALDAMRAAELAAVSAAPVPSDSVFACGAPQPLQVLPGRRVGALWCAQAHLTGAALPNYSVATRPEALEGGASAAPLNAALARCDRVVLALRYDGLYYTIEFSRANEHEFTSIYGDTARLARDAAALPADTRITVFLHEDSVCAAIACPQQPFARSLYALDAGAHAPRPHAWRAVLLGASTATAPLELRSDAQLATFRRGLGVEYARDGTLSAGGEAQVRAFAAALVAAAAASSAARPAARLELQASYADGAWRPVAGTTLHGAPSCNDAGVYCVDLDGDNDASLAANLAEALGDALAPASSLAPLTQPGAPSMPYVAWCTSGGAPTQCWIEFVPGRTAVAHALAHSLATQPPAPHFLRERFHLCAMLSAVSLGTAHRGAPWPRLVRLVLASTSADVLAFSVDARDADIDGSVATVATHDCVGVTLLLLDRALWSGAAAVACTSAEERALASRRASAARVAPALACRLLCVGVGGIAAGGGRRYALVRGAASERDVGRGACEDTTRIAAELRACAGDARTWQLCALDVSMSMRTLTKHLFALAALTQRARSGGVAL